MQSSARILAVANRKGGTGKSTTVVNLAAELAARGYRTLVVDLDPQGHAGLGFGIFAKPGEPTSHSALTSRHAALTAGIRRTQEPDLDVLPADRDFDGTIRVAEPRAFAAALEPLRSAYDVILIDTPPASSRLIVCALLACEGVIVPTALEHLSLDGVRQFAKAYHGVAQSLHGGLLGLAILPMRVDLRSNVQKDVLEHLTRSFGLDQIVSGVRTDTKVSEAFGCRQPLRRYEGRARAVLDFSAVATEIVRRFACHMMAAPDLVAI